MLSAVTAGTDGGGYMSEAVNIAAATTSAGTAADTRTGSQETKFRSARG
jgi:C-terminal processing protease CtpA/Prc